MTTLSAVADPLSGNSNVIGWQHYLAERDQMFLRSRSISVSEMAATLAHELNQPLGAISNILHGLQIRMDSGTTNDEHVNSALNLALQQTQFAARVIARIRDFTESRQPEFVKFDVVDLLQHCVQLMDWVLDSDAVSVDFNSAHSNDVNSTTDDGHDSEQFLVAADYTMLQQVFTNLLRNACDSIREAQNTERVIQLLVNRVQNGIKIEIKDTGAGLKGNTPESLFTPFQSTKESGMGVGLSICKSFIELHQGKLWVTPNKGAGCTAHVLLRTSLPGENDV